MVQPSVSKVETLNFNSTVYCLLAVENVLHDRSQGLAKIAAMTHFLMSASNLMMSSVEILLLS